MALGGWVVPAPVRVDNRGSRLKELGVSYLCIGYRSSDCLPGSRKYQGETGEMK